MRKRNFSKGRRYLATARRSFRGRGRSYRPRQRKRRGARPTGLQAKLGFGGLSLLAVIIYFLFGHKEN